MEKQHLSVRRKRTIWCWSALCLSTFTLACSFVSNSPSDAELERQLREGATAVVKAATEIARVQTEVPEEATRMASRIETVQACVNDLAACAPLPIFEQPAQAVVFGLPLEGAQQAENCAYTEGCADSPHFHTGIDYYGGPVISASGPGVVVKIQPNDVGCDPDVKGSCADHGLGNTIILEHVLEDGSKIYSLYAHLKSPMDSSLVGKCVQKGEALGVIGATGYGLENRWGERPHLHIEFKTSDVLGDPKSGGKSYFGYVKTWARDPHPDNWGYRDPLLYLDKVRAKQCRLA